MFLPIHLFAFLVCVIPVKEYLLTIFFGPLQLNFDPSQCSLPIINFPLSLCFHFHHTDTIMVIVSVIAFNRPLCPPKFSMIRITGNITLMMPEKHCRNTTTILLFVYSWIYTSLLAYIVDANAGRSSSAVSVNSFFRGLMAFAAAEVAIPLQVSYASQICICLFPSCVLFAFPSDLHRWYGMKSCSRLHDS